VTDHDELLARAAQALVDSEDEEAYWVNLDALRAALAAQPEPAAFDMVTELHRAVYGDWWARPESPWQVWEMLLDRVRGLAAGRCGECARRAVAGSATPEEDDG
jgi:hypothetical protein